MKQITAMQIQESATLKAARDGPVARADRRARNRSRESFGHSVLEHLVIVSSFLLRISKFLLVRHRIARPQRHPRHATKQSRRRQPRSFRKTMCEHRFFGIDRAGRPESAPDETIRNRFENEPVTADDDFVVENNRDLRPRWPRPIAKRRDRQCHRSDASN